VKTTILGRNANIYRYLLAVFVALVFVVFAPCSDAADVNARIKGVVTDPQNAVVPNAQIVATNAATGVKFTTTSQSDGGYLFPQLPIGTYSITVSVPGFQSFKASGITLNIDQEYIEAIHLNLGSNSDIVEVAADAVQVNTTDMQLSNIVDASQMVELPLVGRNFTGLELTLPGVQAASDRFGGFSVSGSQSQQSSFLVNGADTNDIAVNTLAIVPNLDAIAQFNLIDGPLNAEYDRNSGAIVTATIKQGANQFHGDIFEFYRDTFLNTLNFFQKTLKTTGPDAGRYTGVVSPFHQNIFGGTLGGPVLRDKLFFFGAYQGTRQSVPQAGGTGNNVLSTANLSGDFSADLNGSSPAGISAFSTNVIPSTVTIPGCAAGTTFAACLGPKGGIVPTSALNTVAAKLAATYVPAATSGAYSYTFNPTTTTTADQYIGRVDYDFNPRNQVTVLGIYQTQNAANGLPFAGASVAGFGDGSITHIQQYTLDYVHQFGASAVNDFSAHYTRFNFNAGAPQKTMAPSSAGFAITPQDTANQTIPTINISGFFAIGGTNNGPQPRIDQVIQADDNFSKVIGHHALKFGYDGRRFNVGNLFDNSNSGSYIFNTSGNPYSSGDASLDFLLGIPATYFQGTGAIIQADAFLNYFFAQDTWKVSNAFTLNYGLGYSIDTPLRNHQYGGEAIDCFIVGQQSTVFPGAPKNMVFPGDPGCTNSGQAYTRYNEFGPRVGFAWAPNLGRISGGGSGKFSIRAGFGIYYDRSEEESALQTLSTPPFGFTTGGASDFGGSPSFINPFADINGGKTTGTGGGPGIPSIPNRFPYVQPVKGQAIDFSSFYPIFNISTFASNFRAPYAENFQLSLEREFPSQVVARLSYVGSLARHNQITYEANAETTAGQAACALNATCIADRNTQCLNFPANCIGNSAQIPEEGIVGSEASASFHSLQASVTKGMSHGLQFQLSYTYAHALDSGSSFENSGFGGAGARGYNQYNQSLNYGDSLFDARQRFVFSPIYTVPFKNRGNTFSIANLALSGWEVSAIVTVATGLPFDISYAGTTSRSLYCSANISFYACPDVPNQIAPLVKINPHTRSIVSTTTGAHGNSGYFSPDSFGAEAIGAFGNVHRDPYHGPGINNTNLILAKNFALSAEGVRRLQIRMESDNVFNHTQFSNPASTFGSGTFGQISGVQIAARLTQLAAKIYF
jgi:Carboxypeptidase regulatory-like domain